MEILTPLLIFLIIIKKPLDVQSWNIFYWKAEKISIWNIYNFKQVWNLAEEKENDRKVLKKSLCLLRTNVHKKKFSLQNF